MNLGDQMSASSLGAVAGSVKQLTGALARTDPRKAKVIELRFFGGLSVEETAEVLQVSAVTVMHDWSTARAWLFREMTSEPSDGCGALETD